MASKELPAGRCWESTLFRHWVPQIVSSPLRPNTDSIAQHSPHLSALTFSPLPLPQCSLSLGGGGVHVDVPSRAEHSDSYSQYFDRLRISPVTAVHHKKEALQRKSENIPGL